MCIRDSEVAVLARLRVEAPVGVGGLKQLANDPNWGFDAQTGEYCDLVAKGIIDPTKVGS